MKWGAYSVSAYPSNLFVLDSQISFAALTSTTVLAYPRKLCTKSVLQICPPQNTVHMVIKKLETSFTDTYILADTHGSLVFCSTSPPPIQRVPSLSTVLLLEAISPGFIRFYFRATPRRSALRISILPLDETFFPCMYKKPQHLPCF